MKKSDRQKLVEHSTEILLRNTLSARLCIKATVERIFSQINLSRPLTTEASQHNKTTVSLSDFTLLLTELLAADIFVIKPGTEVKEENSNDLAEEAFH